MKYYFNDYKPKCLKCKIGTDRTMNKFIREAFKAVIILKSNQMQASIILKNIIYIADKLHFPDNGFGYDMKYYPVFVFYYSKMLEKHSRSLTSSFYQYGLNKELFRNTTTGDLELNRKLGDAGSHFYYLAQHSTQKEKQELSELSKKIKFYTSPAMIDYLATFDVTIEENHFNIDRPDSSNFSKIFTKYVQFLINNEPSFLNIKTLKIIELEDAFFENKNDLRQIVINITPNSAINIASLLAKELDDNDKAFEYLNEVDEVDEIVLEEIHTSLSSNSRKHFENLLGMKFVIDRLNEFA